jgi:small GTP-binding protein
VYDTSGHECDEVRPLIYPKIDVAVICFCLTNRTSLESVMRVWKPQIRQVRPKVPIILVGTKWDLKNYENFKEEMKKTGEIPVFYDEALKVQSKIKAVEYIECSAKTKEGLSKVFEAAVRAAIDCQKEKNGSCSLS